MTVTWALNRCMDLSESLMLAFGVYTPIWDTSKLLPQLLLFDIHNHQFITEGEWGGQELEKSWIINTLAPEVKKIVNFW